MRIDFSLHRIRNVSELEVRIQRHLSHIAQQYQVILEDGPFDIQLEDLIRKLAAEKQIVILIDEYDKPIIDNIGDAVEASRIRDTLRSFYTTIKAMDQYIRFVFITGISKFSKVGVFSTMNHLDDLTLSPRFATALGITEDELVDNFSEHLTEFAYKEKITAEALLEQIRHWYNGFRFAQNGEPVYNPFSTLQMFKNQQFSNYWFETGTPKFLIQLIKEREYNIEPLDQLETSELSFSTYEIDKLELVPLLFQTGYLTIKDYRKDQFGGLYTLSYPNYEVKNAFLTYLLNAYNEADAALTESHLRGLIFALQSNDLAGFFDSLAVFFANIDYDLQINQEKYYQTIFYLIFLLLGVRVSAEVKTNRGRIDAVIVLSDRIFLFEFKLDGSADEALAQIKETDYPQKYGGRGIPVTLVGANFDSTKRIVTEWKAEDKE